MLNLATFQKRVRAYWTRRRAAAWTLRTGEAWCIRPDYRHRRRYIHYDDTPNEDAYQDDVYRLARELADAHGFHRILDVGCGSAYKLFKYFDGEPFVGLEVEPTLSWLRAQHPDRDWRRSDFDAPPTEPFDVVVCADVIEHLPDPDRLLRFLARIDFRFLVLSTPDRDALVRECGADPLGPPLNPHHIREWSFEELACYMRRFFEIERHQSAEYVGQIVVAVPRQGPDDAQPV